MITDDRSSLAQRNPVSTLTYQSVSTCPCIYLSAYFQESKNAEESMAEETDLGMSRRGVWNHYSVVSGQGLEGRPECCQHGQYLQEETVVSERGHPE